MQTFVQVLSEEDRHQVHERSLRILAKTGVRVESTRARTILHEAGASVEEGTHIVQFPRSLIEQVLNSTPQKYSLGGRRSKWIISLNKGECTLLADGEAIYVYDAEREERRLATHLDWANSTRLIDALDEIGLYWCMVQETKETSTVGDFVAYWREVFTNTSKQVQDTSENPEQSRWLLEILQTIFGSQRIVRAVHPFSFLICPLSLLIIEGPYTDAYLETIGWDIPLAIMPSNDDHCRSHMRHYRSNQVYAGVTSGGFAGRERCLCSQICEILPSTSSRRKIRKKLHYILTDYRTRGFGEDM
jgi:trimethylamine:corrinoid methyltransferase-like protein